MSARTGGSGRGQGGGGFVKTAQNRSARHTFSTEGQNLACRNAVPELHVEIALVPMIRIAHRCLVDRRGRWFVWILRASVEHNTLRRQAKL